MVSLRNLLSFGVSDAESDTRYVGYPYRVPTANAARPPVIASRASALSASDQWMPIRLPHEADRDAG